MVLLYFGTKVVILSLKVIFFFLGGSPNIFYIHISFKQTELLEKNALKAVVYILLIYYVIHSVSL